MRIAVGQFDIEGYTDNGSRVAGIALSLSLSLLLFLKWRGKRTDADDNGSFKKKCQQNCSSVFCWSLLLFYSDKVHKQ